MDRIRSAEHLVAKKAHPREGPFALMYCKDKLQEHNTHVSFDPVSATLGTNKDHILSMIEPTFIGPSLQQFLSLRCDRVFKVHLPWLFSTGGLVNKDTFFELVLRFSTRTSAGQPSHAVRAEINDAAQEIQREFGTVNVSGVTKC